MGLFSTIHIKDKSFVVEYKGHLLTAAEAKIKHAVYDTDPAKYGSYMLDFEFNSRKYWWEKFIVIIVKLLLSFSKLFDSDKYQDCEFFII